MGLEQFGFISDLNVNNPASTDKRRQGDDHLRGLKSTLKATFPNANGAINPTVAEFNYLVGVTSGIQAQLDSKLETASLDLSSYGRFDTAQAWNQNQHIPPVDHGNQNGTLIINLNDSDSHYVNVVDDLTISFSNVSEGENIYLWLQQGKSVGGPAVITLSGTFYFPFGTAPNFTSTLNKSDVIVGKYLKGVFVCGFLPEVG